LSPCFPLSNVFVIATDLRGLMGGQLLVRFIDACAEKGLLVMLDMHRLNEKDIPDLVSY